MRRERGRWREYRAREGVFLGERNKERVIKEMKRNWQIDDAGKVERRR